ncbi:MAG: hypothetical protein R3F55_00370 [Alphaproteobacteria bacterium]
MVFGLFKSKQKRREPPVQDAIKAATDALRRLDERQLAAVALQIAATRLAQLELMHNAVAEHPDLAGIEAAIAGSDAHVRAVWYAPLTAPVESVAIAAARYANIAQDAEIALATAPAADPQGVADVTALIAAYRLLAATWLAALFPEHHREALDLWRMLSSGFPHVEPLVDELLARTDRPPRPEWCERYRQTTADGPDGPEYRRIPDGFKPSLF